MLNIQYCKMIKKETFFFNSLNHVYLYISVKWKKKRSANFIVLKTHYGKTLRNWIIWNLTVLLSLNCHDDCKTHDGKTLRNWMIWSFTVLLSFYCHNDSKIKSFILWEYYLIHHRWVCKEAVDCPRVKSTLKL